MGSRRRRPSEHHVHIEFGRRFDPGRRRDQYGDEQLQQLAAPNLCRRAGRHGHRAPQLCRLDLHLGTTAGYLNSRTTDNAGFGNEFDVPFWGAYFVATKGRFFADLMVRQEFYNINLNNPAFAFTNQPIGAHGYSISASTGYNFDLGQGWFIEPSAGFIYSKTTVDSFTAPGVAGADFTGITGIVKTNDVTSQIGRASLRVGKAIATPTVIWQPFASASVFHEFSGDVRSNYTSLNAVLPGPAPFTYNQTTTTSRVGTYGQYSLGLAGQIVNTGWLGFVRVDYRNGEHIDGWTGNAGIRYQFTPETLAAVMPTKGVKAPRAAVIAATNWTGFYAGGFFGAAGGRTDIAFPASPRHQPAVGVRSDRRPAGRLQLSVRQQLGCRRRRRHRLGRRPWRAKRRRRRSTISASIRPISSCRTRPRGWRRLPPASAIPRAARSIT